MKVWSNLKQDWIDLEWSERGKEILQEIHQLARKLEALENKGKKHAIIALIEELSSDIISETYVKEKVDLLFS